MPQTPGVRTKPAQSSRPLKRTVCNVILVDDDRLERTALARLLGSAGYKVTAFERPSEVFRSLLPTKNTCLVLDLYMPEMTGIRLWYELKSRS